MTNEIDVARLSRVFGDRLLIRRRGEPEKKRGILVPVSVRLKKEPKKIWWGEIVAFGEDSHAAEDHNLKVGDVVGVEPIGHHYASWKGSDGLEYAWVPDEHLALADEGSVAEYYSDQIDRKGDPKLRVLGRRVLARPVPQEEGAIVRVSREDESEAKLADVLAVGKGEDIPAAVRDRVLHVVADAGSSAQVDLFDPALLVLRSEDLIAISSTKKEVAHV